MKIAVCVDSIEDLLTIEKLLLRYKVMYPGREIEVEKYSDSSMLYGKISEGKLADIYILDMLMPERTGIELGNQIRRAGGEKVIIYITSSDDYALDAYGIRAVRYLLKPVSEGKLFEALDYALYFTEIKKEPLYLVKTKDGLIQTPYSRIEYIENAYRRLEVHLTGGEVLKSLFIRRSFEEEIQEIAEKKNFQQVHKSFLVNMDYIKQLTMDENKVVRYCENLIVNTILLKMSEQAQSFGIVLQPDILIPRQIPVSEYEYDVYWEEKRYAPEEYIIPGYSGGRRRIKAVIGIDLLSETC